MLWTGGYPPLYDRPLLPRDWLAAYVTAYVERDVRQLLKVQDLESFQRFVRLCAGRSGQFCN
jgi:predicted AAA+ superfamily ATPase